jgi:hypothetical protein
MSEPNWTRGSVWKHLKTGRIYTVIGSCRLEATGEPAVLYTCPDDGILWARATDEFLDGRFERVTFGGSAICKTCGQTFDMARGHECPGLGLCAIAQDHPSTRDTEGADG